MNANTQEYKTGISAFIAVYNEEKRIAYTLESLSWCDEIILLDKNSKDKTREIASRFKNVRIFTCENADAYSSKENYIFLDNCNYKYTIFATASDLMHPKLAMIIRELIKNEEFNYDGIRVPYHPYFLGICEKYSPWYEERSIKVIQRKCISVRDGEVHSTWKVEIKNVYDIYMNKPEEAYYHLTHESADGIIERHRRYWLGEATSPEPLRVPLMTVIKKTIRFIFIKRTFFKGKAAIALAFSYLSYFMMSYVYKWDYRYGKSNEKYAEIRDSISEEWKNTRGAN